MIGLTTHVLDSVHGAGAQGVRIDLNRREGGVYRPLKSVVTRENGRAELLDEAEIAAGDYEIVFAIGDYFRARAAPMADPPFLDEVPVHFSIADTRRHYHVPLIASPWSYATYRGGLPPKGE